MLRASPDDPIRFVMLNYVLQPRPFYSVASARNGRPSTKWRTEVVSRIVKTPILCTKAFIRKHPMLKNAPKDIQDLYNIAQDRAAFRALARSCVLQAQHNLTAEDFEDPPELDL